MAILHIDVLVITVPNTTVSGVIVWVVYLVKILGVRMIICLRDAKPFVFFPNATISEWRSCDWPLTRKGK